MDYNEQLMDYGIKIAAKFKEGEITEYQFIALTDKLAEWSEVNSERGDK